MDGSVPTMRQPPQAISYEQTVLGGLMLDPAAWPRVSDILVEGDFYRHDHQLIFRAIKALAERNRPHDAMCLVDFFEARGLNHEFQGGAYIVELQSTTGSAANIVEYAEQVADRARLRQAIDVGTQLLNDCFQTDGREAAEIFTEATQRLSELQPAQRGGLRRASETLAGWYDRFSDRYGRGNKLTGLATPWGEFNTTTHGLQPATVYLLAARPSMGKSVAALNLAMFTALRGTTTGLFSLEMGDDDCHARNIAALGEVPHDWIIAPTAAEDDGFTERVNDARVKLAASPLYIDDTPSLNVRQFEARARSMHQRNPLGLLVVDHIHDFTIDPKLARFEYGAIVQCGKRLAKEWHIPVVFLAQLNRNVAGRNDKRPTLADLRESGELEQKADVIVFLHREDYYDTPDEQTHLQGVVEMHFAKGRNIRAGGRINLRNRFDQMRLEDWTGPLPKPAPKRQKGTEVGFEFDGRERAAGDDR
jgi:replicative DNA helicase